MSVDVFGALADPTRRAIVSRLAAGERSAGEIGAAFEITAPAVSQHLKTLRASRLIRVRAEAQKRIYELNPEGFNEINQWLSSVQPGVHGGATTLPMAALVQARRLGLQAA